MKPIEASFCSSITKGMRRNREGEIRNTIFHMCMPWHVKDFPCSVCTLFHYHAQLILAKELAPAVLC